MPRREVRGITLGYRIAALTGSGSVSATALRDVESLASLWLAYQTLLGLLPH